MGAVAQHDQPAQRVFFDQLKHIALDTGLLVMFGVVPSRHANQLLRLIDETTAAGGRMLGQTNSTGIWLLSSFLTRMPFDGVEAWREVRQRPLAEQKQLFADPELRRRLVHEAHHGHYARTIGAEAPKPDFETFRLYDDPVGTNPSLADLARERGIDPIEIVIERALATDFRQQYVQPVVPWDPSSEESFLRHPQTVMTFSDSGAHVSQQVSPIQTHFLAHWVRQRQAFDLPEAIRMITSAPARAWGFADRGLVREGYAADLNVLDPATIAPKLPEVRTDLPGGAKRLAQGATGLKATIVGGEVVFIDGAHTGALPGALLRRV